MERGGRRFYRASGEANGAEIIKSLGLAQALISVVAGARNAECYTVPESYWIDLK
jgi:hypothetical protein